MTENKQRQISKKLKSQTNETRGGYKYAAGIVRQNLCV